MLRAFLGDVLVHSISNIWIGSPAMGPGLATNNELLIGTLSSSALGKTHQYKQGLLKGAFSYHICQNNPNTLDILKLGTKLPSQKAPPALK